MTLYNPLEFQPTEAPPTPANPVDVGDEIPEEMDIFYRQISAFLPEGKTLEDLTPAELAKVRAQYRFDHMKPGIYQGITGFGHMV